MLTKTTLRNILTNSQGTDVWTDVGCRWLNDGRMFFRGTAYFRDLSGLEFSFMGSNSQWRMLKPCLSTGRKGEMVLELENESAWARGVPRTTVAEKDIEKRVLMQKTLYQQWRSGIAVALATRKTEMTFRLPGVPQSVSNFQVDDKGVLRIALDGARLIEAADKLIIDDTWLREFVADGGNVFAGPFPLGPPIYEKLFGQRAPIRATVRDDVKPIFDYRAEVSAATQNYRNLWQNLGLIEPPGVPLVAGQGFQTIKVASVCIDRVCDPQRESHVMAMPPQTGYSLWLLGKFPGTVIRVPWGKVEKAIADTGDSLLPKGESNEVMAQVLSNDATTVAFRVRLLLPPDNVRSIKEVAGTLTCRVAKRHREIGLGIPPTVQDVEGGRSDPVVTSISRGLEQPSQQLILELRVPNEAVESISLLSPSGIPLAVSQHAMQLGRNSTTYRLSHQGELPTNGKIVVFLREDIQDIRVPFQIRNISLLGRRLE